MNIQEAYDLSDRQYEEVLGRTADSLGIEKVALEETTKAFLYPVAAGAASAALTYGVPAAVEAVRASRIRSNRDKYITEMKKVHPDMKEIPKADLHIAYNSMAIHTPEVLKDPLMGGQTLKRMARHRMADVNALNEISRLRGTNPLDQALTSATQAFATGVGTGITEIRKQQQADADFAYRKKMDNLKMQMDREKIKLEKDKFDYTQRKDTKQFDYRKARDDKQDVYQKDRDAKADAQTAVSNAFKRTDQKLQADKFTYSKTRDRLSDIRYDAEQQYRKGRDNLADKRYGEEQKYRKGRDNLSDKRYGEEQKYRKGRDNLSDKRYGEEQKYRKEQDKKTRRQQGRDYALRKDQFSYKKKEDKKRARRENRADRYKRSRDTLADTRYTQERAYQTAQDKERKRVARATLAINKKKYDLAAAKPVSAGTVTYKDGTRKNKESLKEDLHLTYDPVTKKYASANLNDVVSMLRYRNR
tara:strand:- start:3458 stop:4876 length:1419 start_codon:yes stop_codon:yes gene_type:complete